VSKAKAKKLRCPICKHTTYLDENLSELELRVLAAFPQSDPATAELMLWAAKLAETRALTAKLTELDVPADLIEGVRRELEERLARPAPAPGGNTQEDER
jgi:anti-sigma factor RsiW